jgi:ADP-heptose:LPS heptosyltransferase
MLSPAQWVDVFRANLRPEHTSVVLLGARADRPAGDAIIAAVLREFPHVKIQNRSGELTLAQSVAALTESAEFWGIDSSLLHLARLIGLRCVSYWGPTNPSNLLRDTWTVDETIHYRKIACSPCVHTSEEPPCHGDNRCIQGLFGGGTQAVNWTPIELPPQRIGRSSRPVAATSDAARDAARDARSGVA